MKKIKLIGGPEDGVELMVRDKQTIVEFVEVSPLDPLYSVADLYLKTHLYQIDRHVGTYVPPVKVEEST